jgi:1-acyl-sn-glycerol-3-phosphate acyltransferase
MSVEQRPGGNGETPGGALISAATPAPVLGSDPFADSGGPDPLDAWLDALDQLAARGHAPADDDAGATDVASPAVGERVETPHQDPAGVAIEPTPHFGDVELPPEFRRLGRLVGEDAARRLSALVGRLEGYDRFGLSRSALQQAFPLFYALYRLYFRVQSSGHEHLPEGPALLVANHGGLLPFDGAMAVLDVLLNTDPPRLPRAIVDRWAGSLPFVNVFFARVGQVVGTHENLARLLADGELVLVFPEGMEGIRKPITQRYRLQRFHVGFVEHALRARAPIVPMAIVGSDDQAPILFDVKPLARLLRLPTAPITPTFPWLGPLGLLPYPVRYRIRYGEPIRFHERFAARAAEDPSLVRALAGQVRRAVQGLIDKGR